MMVGVGELAIGVSLLVVFIGYAVFSSPPVRVFGWTLTAAMCARAFAGDSYAMIVVAGLIGLVISAATELRSRSRKYRK